MYQPLRIVIIAGLAAGWCAATTPPAMSSIVAVAECMTGYTLATSQAVSTIPDGDPSGLMIGPLSTAGTGSLVGVALAVSLHHPHTGDLVLSLHYDADRDGRPNASSTVEFYLARRDLCLGAEAWFCPLELRGTYFFKDDGWRDSGELASFNVFTRLDGGGNWYLSVTDREPGHVGTISGWTVYTETSRQAAVAER